MIRLPRNLRRAVSEAAKPARPWLTVSESSRLGRLILALRRTHDTNERSR